MYQMLTELMIWSQRIACGGSAAVLRLPALTGAARVLAVGHGFACRQYTQQIGSATVSNMC